eukprot:596826-Hanusia_phi.AAC.1
MDGTDGLQMLAGEEERAIENEKQIDAIRVRRGGGREKEDRGERKVTAGNEERGEGGEEERG